MSLQHYEPLSTPLTSYVRLSTYDALLAYCEMHQRGRDTVVDTALSAYLEGQTSGEIAHLRATVEMLQSRVEELLQTHDQP